MSKTKRVRIVLAAKLRADWSSVVEVPVDASEKELAALVNQFLHRIIMDEYVVDDEYWGKGECGFDPDVDADERAAYRAVRDPQGKLVYEKLPDMTRTLWCVVHGEAFVPQVFDSQEAAESFKEQCGDYVSGPWEIQTGGAQP